MARKIAAGLLVAILVCGAASAVDFKLSAGIGGAFDAMFDSLKLGGGTAKSNSIGGGVFAFFDATYAEVDLDLLFAGQSSEGEKTGSTTFFGFSVLGKYPIELGPVVFFPLLGIDYQLWLSKKFEGADKSIARGDVEKPENFDSCSIAAGVGADYSINDLLFIRGEFLWNFRLPGKYEKDMKDLDSDFSRFTSGPRLKVALGFKF